METERSHENEKSYSSRIILNFFRHAEKEKQPPAGKVGDEAIQLTGHGKQQAVDRGAQFRAADRDASQSVAFGSPRERSQQTAGFVMAGGEDEITGTESLEELKVKLDRGRVFGTKLGTDPRLDFHAGNKTFEAEVTQAYLDKHMLTWLVHTSDTRARQLHDRDGSTYLRVARDFSEIVVKYLRTAKRIDQLVREKKYDDTVQKFFGSHQGVPELFMARVIEKLQGAEERDRFVAALDGEGFAYVEGFQVEIQNPSDGSEARALLNFQKPAADGHDGYEIHLPVTMTLLKEMVADGDQFDAGIETEAS